MDFRRNPKKKLKFYNKRTPQSEDEIIKQLVDKYPDIDPNNIKRFEDFPLSQKTLKGLKKHNFLAPTEIQKECIGLALRGYDILGAAKTGSGKTLAFLIPMLERLLCLKWSHYDGLGALVITPTRELAYQIFETLKKVGVFHDFSAGLIIGGKDLKFERKRMDQCNIIICTPGRLLQHMDDNPLFDCHTLQILILDEADRCLDMGFENTMNSIIENLPEKRQTLLFSATQTKSVKDLARLSLTEPRYISVHEDAEYSTPAGLVQSYIICDLHDKMNFLWSFIKNHRNHKILIFLSSCKQVKYTYEAFCRMKPGVSLMALYGTLHQARRMAIYDSFCQKQHAVLFATDIAARGLDFPAVNWVIQLDCPESANEYIHRAGRTARYERAGESLLVLLPSEVKMLKHLEEKKIPIKEIQVNVKKLQNIQRSLESLLARDTNLKESAQRSFVAYIKSVFLMRDKGIFDVTALDTNSYARSLGLAVPPRIRFLKKWHKSQADKTKDARSLDEEHEAEHLTDSDNEDNNGSHPPEKDIEYCDIKRMDKRKKDLQTFNFFNDNEDQEDFLHLKRKDHELEIEPLSQEEINQTSKKSKKPVTKASLAKKMLKKKILPNKKTVFDDDGQAILNKTSEYVSDMAREYAKSADGGIDIPTVQRILREEDKHDKELFKLKVKQKHKEEKIRLKGERKRNIDEEHYSDDSEASDDSNDESSNEEGSSLYDPDSSEEDGEVVSDESTAITTVNRKRKKDTEVMMKNKKVKQFEDTEDVEFDTGLTLAQDEEIARQMMSQF